MSATTMMEVSALDLAELEDSTLMAWVVKGRHGALEVLYDRYANLAYSFALRMLGDRVTAGELVQDAYLRVWERAASFEPHRGSFIKWLLMLIHQLGVEALRQRRAHGPWVGGNLDGVEDAVMGLATGREPLPGTETDAWIALRRGRIGQALSALSPNQRRAVELAFFGGYTQEEIGEVTGEPVDTIRNCMRLSLRNLSEVLHPEDAEVRPA